MGNAEAISVPREETIFIVGISGRLPLRTICVLELTSAEILEYRHKWDILLGDRLCIPTGGPIPHPSRIIKGKCVAHGWVTNPKAARALGHQCARHLTEALAEFPTPLIAHMSKRPPRRAERDVLD